MSCASTYAADDFGQPVSSLLPSPSLSPSLSPFDTLPDELVDSICRHARDLPTLSASAPSASASVSASASEPGAESKPSWYYEPSSRYLMDMRFPPPTTMLTLRLVSKRLSRIATPYMWETLDVQIRRQHQNQRQDQAGNDNDYDTDNNNDNYNRCCLFPAKPCRSGSQFGSQRRRGTRLRSRNSIDILEYVAERPWVAGMVKVLCLRVVGYEVASGVSSSESGSESETGSDHYDLATLPVPIRDLQRRIERLLNATKSLMGFCIDKADLLTPPAASMLLYCPTLRLVDLRTVAFQGEGVRMLLAGEMRMLIGLEYFGLSVFNGTGSVLMLPRNVKRVSLHCNSMSTFVREDEEGPMRMSVGTIEELAIYDKHGDVALFVSKHFSNARKQSQPVVLKELFLDLERCQTTRLSNILSNFQTPTLKKLTIRNLHRMAPNGLSEIAGWFPNVREMALTSSVTDIVPAWIIGCYDEYVEALKGLKSLESLEWDNSAVYYFSKEAEGECGLGASLTVLARLAKLRSVRMISFSSRSVSTCRIRRRDEDERRGGESEYAGYVVVDRIRSGVIMDFEARKRMIAALYN